MISAGPHARRGAAVPGYRRLGRILTYALLLALSPVVPVLADDPTADPTVQLPQGQPSGVLSPPAKTPPSGLARWFDPDTAPFLPIPLIGEDPDSGTTLGLLPVKLQTDDNGNIRRIIAPDIMQNSFFGAGGHARVYDYPSEDTQWSAVAGINQRVQRNFDGEFQTGRLREQRWSVDVSAVFSQDGTPRFFGIGNNTHSSAQTDYTEKQGLMELQLGLNLTHAWQLLYTGRVQFVNIGAGTLQGVPSLLSRFGNIYGVGNSQQVLHRISIGYDTRDNVTAPSSGMEWVVYAGTAARSGFLNDSMYTETGIDGRDFWQVRPGTVLATHVALRYLPTAQEVPFWALSGLGGDQSAIGGDQPLRGYGAGRYYDRNAFSASAELRQRVAMINAVSSHVELELTPFIDIGRVFADSSAFPLAQLHGVAGLGIRGLARPFVVGYVDFGYGDMGLAVFTGINYPF